jgi:hypothetical protein
VSQIAAVPGSRATAATSMTPSAIAAARARAIAAGDDGGVGGSK